MEDQKALDEVKKIKTYALEIQKLDLMMNAKLTEEAAIAE